MLNSQMESFETTPIDCALESLDGNVTTLQHYSIYNTQSNREHECNQLECLLAEVVTSKTRNFIIWGLDLLLIF